MTVSAENQLSFYLYLGNACCDESNRRLKGVTHVKVECKHFQIHLFALCHGEVV